MKTQQMLPKYGNYDEYRVKGGDKYFEHVVYYPKPLPMGQRLSSELSKTLHIRIWSNKSYSKSNLSYERFNKNGWYKSKSKSYVD